MAGIVLAHSARDRALVERIARALEPTVQVWVDQGEIRENETLASIFDHIESLEAWLGLVITPRSVFTRWAQQDLRTVLELDDEPPAAWELIILKAEGCNLPTWLEETCRVLSPNGRPQLRCVELPDDGDLEAALRPVSLDVQGIRDDGEPVPGPRGGVQTEDRPATPSSGLVDPATGRALCSQYPRPRLWHCIFCGWRCELTYDDYLCHQCKALRPFAGGSATMAKCNHCDQWSLAVARFCEWCGHSF